MKKYIPLILLVIGIIVFVIVFKILKNKSKAVPVENDTEQALIDVPLNKKPIISLTPTSDGHYLKLNIEKLLSEASMMDYELIYQVPGGTPQGNSVDSIDIKGKNSFEVDLLLGTESSGKFRYDEGVEEGKITLRFRNDKGKLLARFFTDFHLQSNTDKLTSLDGIFVYTLEKKSKQYFVILNTLGLPGDFSQNIDKGPYGIFSSSESVLPGNISIESANIYAWDGNNWLKLQNNQSDNIGIFVSSKK